MSEVAVGMGGKVSEVQRQLSPYITLPSKPDVSAGCPGRKKEWRRSVESECREAEKMNILVKDRKLMLRAS